MPLLCNSASRNFIFMETKQGTMRRALVFFVQNNVSKLNLHSQNTMALKYMSMKK